MVDAGTRGPVELIGRLARKDGARGLVVLVHGLGGDPESVYLRRMASAADRAGLASLRLGLRGAGGTGADVYHAGMADDVRAALASEALRPYDELYVCGFSIGGHVTLTTARDTQLDPRVRAVAAICPPLDLEATVIAIRRRDRRVYERHVLGGLVRQHDLVAARAAREGRTIPSSPEAVHRVRTIRQWDELVVCRRYGFANAHEYYEEISVGPHLRALARPSLVVIADADPMVAKDTVVPSLDAAGGAPNLEVVRFLRGGHVAFPDDVRIPGQPPTIEAGTIGWLLGHR